MLKKLKSNTGVSIMIALLLFLVCAVISSIVLAAATAASGRISGLEESDRRYYAVTSAAKLFRDSLDGKELTVTRTVDQKWNYTWYDAAPRGDAADGGKSYTLLYRMLDGPATSNSFGSGIKISELDADAESLLTQATLDYVLGVGVRAENDAAITHLPGKDFAWTEKTFTVTPSTNAALIVSATVKSENGALLFTFSNDFSDTPAASKDQVFTLCFTLTPSYSYRTDRRNQTVKGEISSLVEQLLDGEGNPLLDEAGLPRTRTKFMQTDTETTDASVAVTWTASPITVQGGTE